MSDPPKNYFAVLGLPPEADREEIKRAFKELAFKHHPDRNPHNPWAEERFKEAVEAYSYLTGNLEALKALKRTSATPRRPGEAAEDILKILFDIEPSAALTRQQRPLTLELNLTLEEAFRGGEHKVSFIRQDLCTECRGTGVERGGKMFTCTYCFGMGEVGSLAENIPMRECPKCNGRGFLSSKGCLNCRARGSLPKEIKRMVSIPPKVMEGQLITVEGEGHEYRPGERGDLWVTVHLKSHPRFSFDGKDIICETTVEMGEAALGSEVEIPTLGGSTKVALPHGIQSGQILRLKGLGLGGDQFVKVWVKTPVVVSEKERRLMEGFKGASHPASWWQRIKKWFW